MADSGSKAMGSLYDLLLDFVDSARTHDSNYEIALCLVEHYTDLPDMSLREMAQMCFVSQASFSRFCRFLGFSSFAEFKESVDSANYELLDDYSHDFLADILVGDSRTAASYRTNLHAIIDAAISPQDLKQLSRLLDALRDAKRVVFFSHHFLWHVGRYLQGKLLPLGRFIEVPQSFEHQLEAARSLREDDLAIICSMNGSYFSHYHDIVRAVFDSKACTAALTQNTHALYLNRADIVLSCGDTNRNDVGKYAALMTMDLLAMGYMRRAMQEMETPER